MAAGGHFGCPKITFGRISGHFRSICNFNLFWKCLTKWLLAAILDVRNSLSVAFLAISDRSAILNFRNSLSIAILAISDRYRILFFRRPFWMFENHFGLHFWPFQIDRPFWISEIHFRWHFWPFQIHMELYLFFIYFDKTNFGCPQITFTRISGHFRSIRNFLFCLTKWPPAAILDGTTMSIIELVRDIWMSNACVKFEERSLNPSKVIALTTKLWRGGPRPRCGGCVADENIIFLKTYVLGNIIISSDWNNI